MSMGTITASCWADVPVLGSFMVDSTGTEMEQEGICCFYEYLVRKCSVRYVKCQLTKAWNGRREEQVSRALILEEVTWYFGVTVFS